MRNSNLDDVPILFKTLKELGKNDLNVASLITDIIVGKGRIIDKDNFIIFSTDKQYYDDGWSVMSYDVTIDNLVYSNIENAKLLIETVHEETNKIYHKEHIPIGFGKAKCCGMFYYYHLIKNEKNQSLFESFDYEKINEGDEVSGDWWIMRKWKPNMDYYENEEK